MSTLVLNDNMSLLSDPSFRLTAEKLAIKCGIRADLMGFNRIVDAVILCGVGECTNSTEIYARVGALRNIKPKSVLRVITYAIRHAFDLPARLSAMIGIPIPESDIHSGLVIAYLGRLFQNPSLALYA